MVSQLRSVEKLKLNQRLRLIAQLLLNCSLSELHRNKIFCNMTLKFNPAGNDSWVQSRGQGGKKLNSRKHSSIFQ